MDYLIALTDGNIGEVMINNALSFIENYIPQI